jgi:protein-tyrosine phosphatase
MTALSNPSILRWRWQIGEVTDGLFVGGDLPADDIAAAEHLADWLNAGVTHILDVREEWSDEAFVAALDPDVGYTHLGTHDNGGEQHAAWFDAGTAAARHAADTPGAGLLVHCHMGINRGPTMAFAILLDRGWDPVDALDAIRAARPIAAIGYAEDALRWHLARTGASPSTVRAARQQVQHWHEANDIDLARVIRQIRTEEAA